MGGPIVRTGTTPKFWENWDKAFGGKKSGEPRTAGVATKSAKGSKKGAAKAAVKNSAGKKSKKAAGKRK